MARQYFAVCIFQGCPPLGNAHGIVYYQNPNASVPLENAPPFRSDLRYDAKVWQYVINRPGKILLWNVA